VSKLLPLAVKAFEARHLRISTGELNRVFEAVLSDPRAIDVAKAMRLHYITQADIDPPTFVVFASARSGKMGEPIERYLSHQLRARYEFFATPIRVRLRRR
jgi:GTP-binding protein